jgi:hypothetical protein
VGALVSNPPLEKEVPTAELPRNGNGHEHRVDARLSTDELEATTVDTQPLPDQMSETLEIPMVVADQSELHEEKMETATTEVISDTEPDSADVLLDLGEIEHADVMEADDFVLDLDDAFEADVIPEPAPMRAFVEPEVTESVASGIGQVSSYQPQVQAAAYPEAEEVAYEDQVHELAPEPKYQTNPIPVSVEPEVAASEPQLATVAPDRLSPEMVDAIAKRVVEMMSEKVVQEIAWEVVPDLAELLIKKRLEEKESQAQ